MKYLKEFNIHNDYLDYIASSIFASLESDSVSYCVQQNDVHFDKYVETRIITKFNVTDTSNPIKIRHDWGYGGQSTFDSIEIDNVLIDSNIPTEYTFNTTGEHTIKYSLTDSTQIKEQTFYGCYNMTSIIIPDSVLTLGQSVFDGCNNLTHVTIGKGVTSIYDNVFDSLLIQRNNFINNSSLDEVTNNYWGASIYDIEENGLCINNINSSIVKYIGNATTVTIPNTITHINEYAFNDCDSLTSIVIPDNVTSMGRSTFENSSNLTSVTIGSGLTEIPMFAFQHCINIESIVIPNTVITIDTQAFSDCKNARSITIGSGATSIQSRAFSYCYVTSFTNNSSLNASSNDYWGATVCDAITEDGLCVNNNNTIIDYIGTATTLVIPNNITTIAQKGLYGKNLVHVTIPASVTSIGQYGLRSCMDLESITCYATTAPSIQSGTFDYVKKGGTLYVPQGSTGYDAWMSKLSTRNWTKVEQ